MIESKFKAKQRGDFEKKGWKFIQLDPGAGVPTGFPDTLVISPTGYCCFIEWKKAKNSAKQPLQEYWNKKLNGMGHDAFFVHPANVQDWRKYVISKSNEYITVSVSGKLPRPTWQ